MVEGRKERCQVRDPEEKKETIATQCLHLFVKLCNEKAAQGRDYKKDR